MPWSIPKGIERQLHTLDLKDLYKKHPKRDWKDWRLSFAPNRKLSLKHPKRDWKIFINVYDLSHKYSGSIPKGIERLILLVCSSRLVNKKDPKRDWKKGEIARARSEIIIEASQKGLKGIEVHVSFPTLKTKHPKRDWKLLRIWEL